MKKAKEQCNQGNNLAEPYFRIYIDRQSGLIDYDICPPSECLLPLPLEYEQFFADLLSDVIRMNIAVSDSKKSYNEKNSRNISFRIPMSVANVIDQELERMHNVNISRNSYFAALMEKVNNDDFQVFFRYLVENRMDYDILDNPKKEIGVKSKEKRKQYNLRIPISICDEYKNCCTKLGSSQNDVMIILFVHNYRKKSEAYELAKTSLGIEKCIFA